LTIVAFGTSSPEKVVRVKAALDQNGAIALGNVIGSNICNILAIVGLASLIRPLGMDGLKIADLVMMTVTAVLILPMAKSGFLLSRLEGALLLMIYSCYICYLISGR